MAKCRTRAQQESSFRKILLVSVKFLSAILGPEMGASILWTPGRCVLSAGKTHVHKIPRFRGGGLGFLGGGGSADFIFMGARIFLIHDPSQPSCKRCCFAPRSVRNIQGQFP